MTRLHLVDIPVRLREFTQWALQRQYLAVPRGDGRGQPRDPDMGYALHAALTGLFGVKAPRPFRLALPRHRGRPSNGLSASGAVPLLGYVSEPLDHLLALAQVAERHEELADVFDLKRTRSRPLPPRWPPGLRLAFDLGACPVRRRLAGRALRTNSKSERQGSVYSSSGRELDAFQLDAARAEESGVSIPSREESYRRWLGERFLDRQSSAGATLVEGSVRIESYRSVRLLRRPADGRRRTPQWLTRPEVCFSGQLEVSDSEAFSAFLGRGVGRHCGFGFGMLLLKPA